MLIAAVPVWIWATVLMVVFVAVSAGTMLLARYAIRQPAPEDRAQDPPAPER